jgi:hypothetical protein
MSNNDKDFESDPFRQENLENIMHHELDLDGGDEEGGNVYNNFPKKEKF